MGNPIPSRDAMKLAADIAEKCVLADFGGNDIAGLRNGIMADAAIADFVQSIAQIRADAYEQAAKAGGAAAKAAVLSFARIGDGNRIGASEAICYDTETAIRALSDQPDSTDEGLAELLPRYRHVKRGTVYEVIGEAELQMNSDLLCDGSAMIVYRGEDGKLWVREESEFHDGRFTALSLLQQKDK